MIIGWLWFVVPALTIPKGVRIAGLPTGSIFRREVVIASHSSEGVPVPAERDGPKGSAPQIRSRASPVLDPMHTFLSTGHWTRANSYAVLMMLARFRMSV